MKKEIRNLTLLLLYLSGWEEDSRKDPGQKVRRAWKGYTFEIINELEENGLIQQVRNAKSVLLTAEGLKEAQQLKANYLKEEASDGEPF